MADGSVIIDTELDQSGLKEGLASLGTNLSKGIATAVAAAGAALVGLGKFAIDVGSDFEYAISGVAATMGKTKEEITVLSDKAKELGASTKFTATEAAEGFNILAMAGLSLDEQLQAIDATLSLASAGEMAMNSAAGYLTTTVKAMSTSFREAGINMSDCTRIADMYAKGATLANTSTAQLGEAVSVAASIGGSYNQSLSTITTSLLALAEKGYQGSQAGNYLARAMSDLYAPTDNAQKALKNLGVSIYDAEGNQRDFIDIVNDLNASFATLTEEEKAAYTGMIFTTAGLKAFNSIAGNSADQLAELQGKLEDCTGAAQAMADTKLDNLQGDITILKSATEGFGIAFYDALSKVGEGTGMMRDFVKEATDIMGDLTAAVNEGGFDGLVNALGSALSKAVNKIIEYVPMLIEGGVQIVSSLVQGLSASADGIASSVASLISIVIDGFLSITTDLVELGGELIVALCEGLADNADKIVETIVSGIVGLVNKIIEYLPKVVQAGLHLIRSLVQGIMNALPELLGTVPNMIKEFVKAIADCTSMFVECVSELIVSIMNALPGLIDKLVKEIPGLIQTIIDELMAYYPKIFAAIIQIVNAIAKALPEIIVSIIEILPDLIESIIGGILELIPMLIECVLQLILAIVAALPQLIQSIVGCLPKLIGAIINGIIACIHDLLICVLDIILAIVRYLPEIILNIIACIPTLVGSIISAIVDCIPMLIECVLNLVIAIVGALPDIIIRIIEILPTLIASIVSGLLDCVPQLISCAGSMIGSIVKVLPKIFMTVAQKLMDLVSQLAENVKNLWTKFKAAAEEWIAKIWQGIKDKWSTFISNIKSFFSQIPDKIKEGIGDIASVGKNLVQGIWNGISNATQWVLDKIKGFGKSIVNGIKDIFGIHSPSTVFRDIVGKNLALGLAEGIEENSKVAIDAAKSLADKINDVDYSIDGDVILPSDYDRFVLKMQGAVDQNAEDAGTAISAGQASSFYVRGGDVSGSDGGNGEGDDPKYIENNIYVDGKKTARILTPYVAKELEWEEK